MVEFQPFANLTFMVFSISGLGMLGEKTSYPMNALIAWLAIHQPELISAEFRKRLVERGGLENIEGIKGTPKQFFYESYIRLSMDR